MMNTDKLISSASSGCFMEVREGTHTSHGQGEHDDVDRGIKEEKLGLLRCF